MRNGVLVPVAVFVDFEKLLSFSGLILLVSAYSGFVPISRNQMQDMGSIAKHPKTLCSKSQQHKPKTQNIFNMWYKVYPYCWDWRTLRKLSWDIS
jgi:hypothetical protein